MAVKVYTRGSSVPLSEFRDQLKADSVFALLTEAQQNTVINEAVDQYNEFSIEELESNEYEFDTIADASNVFTPTLSSYENLFVAYIKIKFGEYDGDDIAINDVDATKVLLVLDEGNITIVDTDPDLTVYTLPITGATLDRTYKIMPPTPAYVDVELSGNNVIVTAPKNHVAFDIEIEKKKES